MRGSLWNDNKQVAALLHDALEEYHLVRHSLCVGRNSTAAAQPEYNVRDGNGLIGPTVEDADTVVR